MKHILIPTDFSDCADNAVEFAIQSANIIPSEITLLHSYEVNNSAYSDYMGLDKGFKLTMINKAEEKLKQLKVKIEKTNAIKVDTMISTESLKDAISKFVNDKSTDMIVMGTHGAGGIKEKLWGSNTSLIIGQSAIPVLVIPMAYKWAKPRKLLFATREFEETESILNYLFELAGLYMAEVQVAVFTDEDDEKAKVFIERSKKISQYELSLKEKYQEDTLHSVHLTGDNFEESLQEYIEKNDVDILVMITYQKSFLERIFQQSKTKKMSFHTTIPLLAIPAGQNLK